MKMRITVTTMDGEVLESEVIDPEEGLETAGEIGRNIARSGWFISRARDQIGKEE